MAEKKVIIRNVFGCFVVIAILMSVMSTSVLGVNANITSVSGMDKSTLGYNETVSSMQGEMEIKFIGTAVERCGIVAGADYWVVTVDELISGPSWSGQLTVYTINIFADSPTWGYADPDITVGDKVEVYGKCVVRFADVYYVTLNGREDYYIKKKSDTPSKPDLTITRIWFNENPCNLGDDIEIIFDVTNQGTGVADPCVDCLYIDGSKVAEFDSSGLAIGSELKPGETRTWYYLYEYVPGNPDPHEIKACADCQNSVTESDESNNCKIDNLDVESGKEELKFTGTSIEYFSRMGACGWTVRADEIISGPSELQSHTVSVALWSVDPDQYPPGYIDPNIEPGNKVEVYGLYVGEDDITLSGSKDYYIKKIAVTYEDWPMFRHDTRHTGYSSSITPNNNNIAWIYETEGKVTSSPAVANSKVFVGSDDGHVYCLDERTGKPIWIYKTNGSVRSSPAVANGKVFIGSRDHNIYCLNETTGELIWSTETGDWVDSSPTVTNSRVFVGSKDYNIYCLDENTGRQIWNRSTKGQVYSSPAVADGVVYIGDNYGKIYALRESDGKLNWDYKTRGSIESSPAVANGKVYVGSFSLDYFYCFEVNGKLSWKSQDIKSTVTSSPAFANDKVFIGSRDNKIYCLNGTTGDLIWSKKTGNCVDSSPAIADEKVFVGSCDGKIYAFEDTGELVWSYETGDEIWSSSPAVANGKVFIGSNDGKVYAFGSSVSGCINFDELSQGDITGQTLHYDQVDFVAESMRSGGVVAVSNFDHSPPNGIALFGGHITARFKVPVSKVSVWIGDWAGGTQITLYASDGKRLEEVNPRGDFTYYEFSYDEKISKVRISSYEGAFDDFCFGIEDGQPLSVHNLNTGEDFSTIQAAIDVFGTSPGDTITVDPGTYTENVDVTKSLTIKSTSGNPKDTIVQAQNSDDSVFEVTADDVTISGFTVDGGLGSNGIYLNSVKNCEISNNNCSGHWAIVLGDSSNNAIIGNNCSNNDVGISLWNSNNNALTGNNITSNYIGIEIGSSSGNILTENTLLKNNWNGVYLQGTSSNNELYHNNFISNSASDLGTLNLWDNDYPSGGNYWSDYDEESEGAIDEKSGPNQDQPGSDGIADTAYEIPGGVGAKDNYPLMEPWGVEQLPDLTLSSSDLSFSNPNPVVGDTVTITATIHNIGNADATDVVVQFFDGDPVNGMQVGTDQTIDLVSANGGIGTAQVGWTATEGVHEIYVVVDRSNAITEFDEENNIAFNTIIVGLSAPEHWFNNYYFNNPGLPYDSGPRTDEKFEDVPSELGGWGIRGATWKWKEEGLFKIHEVQFVGKDVEENNYGVHMNGTDNTKTEEGYAVVSLLQGNAWNGYPGWYIPEPLTIDDHEIYIDTRLKRGDADESDDPHPTKGEISDREMYAADLWFVESDVDPHTLNPAQKCEKCRNEYLRRLVLDLIFHVGQKQQGVVEDNRDDGYDMAYPSKAEGKGVIFHYEPSVVSENYCSGFPKDEWLDCVAKHPFVGLPTEEWVSVEGICVNEYIRDAVSLSQDASKWTWNNDSLSSEEVKFEDPSKLILCQGEMIIELRDADGELTVGGFDLYYYPKEPSEPKTEIRGVFVRPSDLFIGVDMTNIAQVNNTINKMADDLDDHNINTAFLAFKSDFGDGRLFYETEKYPEAYYFEDKGLTYDPIENLVNIFHNKGIEVHAWVPAFNDTFFIDNADKIFTDPGEVRQPDSETFVDPNNPYVLEYEESIINEILEKYSVNGINLDYIRYESKTAYDTSKINYNKDGAEEIVRFVRNTLHLCCKENVILSADVFGSTSSAEDVGQDIPQISKYVNVLMPMLYFRCPGENDANGIDYYVKDYKNYNDLVVPCIRAFNPDPKPEWAPECSPSELKPAHVMQFVEDSEESGDGFALFNYMTIVAKQWGENIGERVEWNNGLEDINSVLIDQVITPWKQSGWINEICRLPLTITATCPVDLTVTDPDGLTINKQSTEIPAATYREIDLNGGADLDDQIIIPDRKIGDYQITVIPEPDAEPTDTYTLKVSIGDTTTVLAENVPISKIPAEPYIFKSGTNQLPRASFLYTPENPVVGQVITLNASSSAGFITNYKWDFGDGRYGTGKVVTHSYANPGTYSVTLTVEDNEGNMDTNTQIVEVTNVAPTRDIPISTAANSQLRPTIAYNPANNEYLVTWDDKRRGSEREIYAQKVSGANNLVGSNFAIALSSGTDIEEVNPFVVYNPTANEYLVVWNEKSGYHNLYYIYAQRVSNTGSLVGDKITVSSGGVRVRKFYPTVAYNPANNEYLVVWYGQHVEGQPYRIYGQRLSRSGSLLSSNFAIGEDIGKDNYQYYPQVVYNAHTNDYLVVWEDMRNGGEKDIYAQRVSGSGSLSGSNYCICSAANAQEAPSVAYNSADNQYLVTWQDGRTGNNADIYAQMISSTGNLQGNEIVVRVGSGTSLTPSVTYNSKSNVYFVAWEETDDIFAQEITSGGGLSGSSVVICDAATNQGEPSVAYNSANNLYFVTWYDYRNGNYDIYGTSVQPSQLNSPPNKPIKPSPSDGATSVSIDADLSWTSGGSDAGDTVTYDVYFGTSASPPLVANDQSGTTYDPGTLSKNTRYYWKIIATDNNGATSSGDLWNFTTGTVQQFIFQSTDNAVPITIDGTLQDSPYTASWTGGTSHSVNALSEFIAQPDCLNYVFTGWTGVITQADTLLPPTLSPGTYTANYKKQYYLTVDTEPQGIATISGEGWYDEGAMATTGNAPKEVTVGDEKYQFETWKVDGSPVSLPFDWVQLKMDNCHTVTASYREPGGTQLLWLKTYDFDECYDRAYAVATDSKDNIIVTGKSDGEWLTIKYDPNGNELWTKRYENGRKASGVAVDSNDNIIVVGDTDIGGTWNYLIIKYDPSGNRVWYRRLASGYHEYPEGVAVDSNDNIIVTGRSHRSTEDCLTVKFNSNGDVLWTKYYDGGQSDEAHAVAVDSKDNIIVTGESRKGGFYGDQDYLAIKYDPNGNVLCTKKYDSGDENDDNAYGIAVDSNDNFIVTGYGYNGDKIVTIKYNRNGELLWEKTFEDGAYARGVAVDSYDNIVVAGESKGANDDFLTIKYDSNGNVLWSTKYDGGNDDHARGVAVDSENNIIVTGDTWNGKDYAEDYLTIKYGASVTQTSPPNKPSNPFPSDGATAVSIDVDLSWTGGDPDAGDTVTYDVYFGTSTSPQLDSNDQTGTTYDPGTLSKNTKYYWKIIATDNHGASTTGDLWNFNTVSGEEFPKRKPIKIDNTRNANTLTDYQVKLDVIYDPEMQPDFDDLGFTDSSDNSLNYWVEDYTPSAHATVWVKIPLIPGSGTTTVYMYYGNPSASSQSNGDATFVFFDDFEDESIDTGKWTTATTGFGAFVTENSGEINIHTDAISNTTADLISQNSYGPDVAILFRASISAGQWLDHKGLGFLSTNVGNDWDQVGDSVHWRGQDDDLYASNKYSDFSTNAFIEDGYFSGYRTWEIAWLSSEIRYYSNGILKATHTTNVPSVAITPRFSLKTYTSAPANPLDVFVDSVYVRKYADPEPTITIKGT